MVIDELIQRLQKLSHAGFGGHAVMVAMNTSEPRVGFIGKVLSPLPEETNPDSPAPEARSMPWSSRRMWTGRLMRQTTSLSDRRAG